MIQVKAGGSLALNNLSLNLAAVTTASIITADTSGSSDHYNFSMRNCRIFNCNANFFSAAKSSVADSIIVNNCSFSNGRGNLFQMVQETDKKGYYNTEQLTITGCTVTRYSGQILSILRGGNDESTMGPMLVFNKNKFIDCTTDHEAALIHLFGVQYSVIEKNSFLRCNPEKKLIQYEYKVKAVHHFRKNKLAESGRVITNQFVIPE